ncbi:MAG: PleD family two-component system response regulator [Thermosynechococcaceae cyanobacterium]
MIQQAPVQQETLFFGPQELASALMGAVDPGQSGYWEIKFDRLAHKNHRWYFGLQSNQAACYSGTQPHSSCTLLKTIKRYLAQSRREPARSFLAGLQKTSKTQSLMSADMIEELMQMNVLDVEQLTEAMRLKILADLDIYLTLGAGQAHFMPEPDLANALPIPGFPLEQLFAQAQHRQQQWEQVKKVVPSMAAVPILDSAALEKSGLPEARQQWLQNIVKSGKPLSDISVLLAKDTLEVAARFAQFKQAGIIHLESETHAAPESVMIIDDSPIVLMQFQHLVTALGYPVVVNQEAEKSIPMIAQVKPAIIFIDINMPGISGFELVKKIRQTPEIASIPLVILTGEQKLSNKWRAQWSGCDFLTKPLSLNEIEQFQVSLQAKLQAVMPEKSS